MPDSNSPYSVRYDDAHIKLDSPDGSSQQHRIVRLGFIDLVFSFETLVAFRQNIRTITKAQFPDQWKQGDWVMRNIHKQKENEPTRYTGLIVGFPEETIKHLEYYGVPINKRFGEWEFWVAFREAILHPQMLLHFLALETLESLDEL